MLFVLFFGKISLIALFALLLFMCSIALWLLLNPSFKGNSLTRVGCALQVQIHTRHSKKYICKKRKLHSNSICDPGAAFSGNICTIWRTGSYIQTIFNLSYLPTAVSRQKPIMNYET